MTHGPARHVLRLIDQAETTRERHPTLFHAQLRAGEKTGRDRDVLQLAAAVARYQQRKPASKSRPDRDEVERIDPHWEEIAAREAEEHDRGRRLRINTQERARRRNLTGLQLLQETLERVHTISTVPASNIEPSRAGSATHGGVPAQQTLDDDPAWQMAVRIIHRQAMVMADLVDAAQGFARATAVAALSEEEKNDTLREEGAGLTAAELFHRLGPEYGSESYIRRWRKREGLDHRGRLSEGG